MLVFFRMASHTSCICFQNACEVVGDLLALWLSCVYACSFQYSTHVPPPVHLYISGVSVAHDQQRHFSIGAARRLASRLPVRRSRIPARLPAVLCHQATHGHGRCKCLGDQDQTTPLPLRIVVVDFHTVVSVHHICILLVISRGVECKRSETSV